MTSPKKSLQVQKDATLFGDLSHVEKTTSRLGKQLTEDIQTLKRVEAQFKAIQKQAGHTSQDFKVKSSIDISKFEQKIKNYLTIQKGEYSRFANQINQIIITHKDINNQLQILSSRFEQYKKNVGI